MKNFFLILSLLFITLTILLFTEIVVVPSWVIGLVTSLIFTWLNYKLKYAKKDRGNNISDVETYSPVFKIRIRGGGSLPRR